MKGGMLSQFHVGQHVMYVTKNQPDPKGGRIVKLHKSSTCGVAEIKPDSGFKKIARRLIHVRAA